MPAGTWNMPSRWMLSTITTTRAVQPRRDRNISLGSRILPAFPSRVVFSARGPCGGEERWELLAGSITSLRGTHRPRSRHSLSPAQGRFARQHPWDPQGLKGRTSSPAPSRAGSSSQESPNPPSPHGTSGAGRAEGRARGAKSLCSSSSSSSPSPDHAPAAGMAPLGAPREPFHMAPGQEVLKVMWVHNTAPAQGGGRATPRHAKPRSRRHRATERGRGHTSPPWGKS